MVSVNFYPSIGGIEIMTENLAYEFHRMGHDVTIVTMTKDDDKKRSFPFIVLRNPSKIELLKSYFNCDVYIHQSISLKYVWPLFLRKKPFYIVYHQVGWEAGLKGKIKKFFSYFAHNICVSKTTAIGYDLKKYDIIYNAYDDSVFKLYGNYKRKDIAFVGRLNRDKGAYLLIDAFNDFKDRTNSDYKLDMIGDSNERMDIEIYASKTKYASDIYILGSKNPKEVAEFLNQHKILAVTSTHPYYEAFGIVVLEGLACGCNVVGADGDGIEEALHGCGELYKNGDMKDLSKKIEKAIYTNNNKDSIKWLESRTIYNVANEYIKILKQSR